MFKGEDSNEKGLIVFGLLPGCPAEKAGVKKGDSLFSVNGMRIISYDDFAKARELNKFGMDVTVIRDRKILDLSMQYVLDDLD